jgi:hypothetical protein
VAGIVSSLQPKQNGDGGSEPQTRGGVFMNRFTSMLLALSALLATEAQAQSIHDYGRAIQQQQAEREQMLGVGPDVRFQPFAPYLNRVFQQEPAYPLQINPPVTVDEYRTAGRPDFAFRSPLEFGSCRLVMTGGLEPGAGAQFGYGCTPESSLAFVLLSYEVRPSANLDQVSNDLTRREANLFGYSVPQCASHPAPVGVERAVACTSTFQHYVRASGNTPIPGRSHWVVGTGPDFFFVATTVCAGSQCDGALPAFEAFVSGLDFSHAQAPATAN